MNSDRPTLSPEQARQRLADLQGRSLDSPRDRGIHATGTAIFGLTVAFYMATQNVMTGAARMVLSVVVLVILVAEGVWVERAARTVPRRARLWSRLGIGGSFVVALGFVLPWLNFQAQERPNTTAMVAVAAILVAVPSLGAAAIITRYRR